MVDVVIMVMISLKNTINAYGQNIIHGSRGVSTIRRTQIDSIQSLKTS